MHLIYSTVRAILNSYSMVYSASWSKIWVLSMGYSLDLGRGFRTYLRFVRLAFLSLSPHTDVRADVFLWKIMDLNKVCRLMLTHHKDCIR